MIANYQLYKNITPVAGKNYLDSSVKQKMSDLTQSSPKFIENAKRWKSIFERYGKIPAEKVADAPDDTALKQDEFYYD
jgi:hypothetical protein